MDVPALTTTQIDVSTMGLLDTNHQRLFGPFSFNDPAMHLFNCDEKQTNLDPKGCLTHAAMWRGIKLITDVLAKIPFHVLKNNPQGGSEKDTNHPSYSLLRRVSNRRKQVSAGTWKSTMCFHAVFMGNAFSVIQRDAQDNPISLTLVPPDLVHRRTVMKGNTRIPVYTVQWEDQEGESKTADILLENMFHIKTLSWDGIWGEPFWEYAKPTVELGVSTREFGTSFFSRGATPTAIIKHPAGWSEKADKKFKKSLKTQYAGLGKANSLMVLEDTVEYIQMTIPPEAAQFLETREFSNKEIALFLGLNPASVGVEQSVSYNSLEMQLLADLAFAFDPWLCAFEDEANIKLLRPRQLSAETHKCEFRREAFVRTDMKTKYEGIRGLFKDKLITRTEARLEINRPSLGPEDDKIEKAAPLVALPSGETKDDPEDIDQTAAAFVYARARYRTCAELKRIARSDDELLALAGEDSTQRAIRINKFSALIGDQCQKIGIDPVDESMAFWEVAAGWIEKIVSCKGNEVGPTVNAMNEALAGHVKERISQWPNLSCTV